MDIGYLQPRHIEDPGVDSLQHWTILRYVSPEQYRGFGFAIWSNHLARILVASADFPQPPGPTNATFRSSFWTRICHESFIQERHFNAPAPFEGGEERRKKKKAFLGSDWRPTCGSFEGGERMRLTYWLVFRCLSRVIFFAVPSFSDVICFRPVKIETRCSDIQSHSCSQVCFHSMLMKLDFEELCIDCGRASINRKSQGEVLSTVDSLALSLWHFVASVQLPEAPAASFMANFLLAPWSAVGEYWEICIHTAAAQLCKQPSI